MKHVVKKNDTLQKLAAYYYGDWSIYRFLQDYNQIEELVTGQVLMIPSPPQREEEHIIQEGHTYRAISLQYYQTEHFSEKVREYNQNIILSEHIGEILFIPPLVNFKKYQKTLKRLEGRY